MRKSIDHREAVKVYGGKKTLELLKSLYEKGVLIRGRTNGRINWKNCQIVVESIVKE